MLLPKDYLNELLLFIKKEKPSKKELTRRKAFLAKKYSLKKIPTDIEILTNLNKEEIKLVKPFLQTKPVRTKSGVSVVAVMTKPMPCPHGKCTYCPGGPNSFYGDVPQSYTGHEPATMRAKRADYDVYIQIFNRLEQYLLLGYDPEKVELIIMGGTFPSYPEDYQEEVIKNIFAALNDFSFFFFKDNQLLFSKFKEFFELPLIERDKEKRSLRIKEKIRNLRKELGSLKKSIKELQRINEKTKIRCVGLTIETRPTEGFKEHGLRMLEQGCTRIELGVQTTFDEALKAVHRDHTTKETVKSIRELKDLGFKLNFHIMLGLPRMNPDKDLEALRELFFNEDYQPDMLKIYPCMVMPGTALYEDYKKGKYKPYDTLTASKIIDEALKFIPEYVRIMRVQRDIPTKVTISGVDKTNLRQYLKSESRDIRAREIKDEEIKDYAIKITKYKSSKGSDFFIQVYETNIDKIIGFCRLRFPSLILHPVITKNSALIRELHVYGRLTPLGKKGLIQHQGFGKLLLKKAEEIALINNKEKIIIISGIGVRDYYRKQGYELEGPYMVKYLKKK